MKPVLQEVVTSSQVDLPTDTPLLADSSRAWSTISFRFMVLEPRRTALQVITTFGLQSVILWERASTENPANTTWKKPVT